MTGTTRRIPGGKPRKQGGAEGSYIALVDGRADRQTDSSFKRRANRVYFPFPISNNGDKEKKTEKKI